MLTREDAELTAQSIGQTLTNITRLFAPAAKVISMASTSIFNADRFVAWIYNIEDGLSTTAGVALATVFAAGSTIDNIWGRAFSMYRRELEEKEKTVAVSINPYLNASLFSPGVPASIPQHLGYLIMQGFNGLYIFNSIPGGFLNSFSMTKLFSRLSGTKPYNPFCLVKGKPNSEMSSYPEIITVNLIGAYISYASILSFQTYNIPQIRFIYIKFFIENEIRNVSLASWLETLIGVSTNTLGIMFQGIFALQLLRDASLCHLNIGIDDFYLQMWVYQMCVTNMAVNGISTLWAVHQRRTHQHALNRAVLAKALQMSPIWDLTLRTGIGVNAIGGYCGTQVAAPTLPGRINPDLKYLSYNLPLILTGAGLGVVTLLNQYAISSESDVRERKTRWELVLLKNKTIELELEEQSLSEKSYQSDEKPNPNIYQFVHQLDYGSNGKTFGRGTPLSSSRHLFFQAAELKEDKEEEDNNILFNNRFNLPDSDADSSWLSSWTIRRTS